MSELCGLRALIVDGDVDSRDLYSFVLRDQGIEVMEAASTVEAMSAIDHWHPDVVICEVDLADEGGYALLRKVRGSNATVGKQVPAIAITCLPRQDDCLKIVSRGFQKYFSKPTDLDQLIEAIAELVGRRVAV